MNYDDLRHETMVKKTPTEQGEQEDRKMFDASWREDQPAYDFSNEPVLLNNLGFLKFLYGRDGRGIDQL